MKFNLIRLGRKLYITSCLLMVSAAFLTGCRKDYMNPISSTGTRTLTSRGQVKMSASNLAIESSSFTVMDDNIEAVYLGNILSGKQLLDLSEFNPLVNYQKLPIRISCSFPGTDVGSTIAVPRMSSYWQSIQDILRKNNFAGNQIGSFAYNYIPFNDYDEIRREFGYNVNVRGLFSSSSSSVVNSVTTVKKRFGFVASFEVENFTADISLPKRDELVNDADFAALVSSNENPLYVNSISYGQRGIIAVETDIDLEETNRAFSKVTNKIFKKTTETLTEYEKHLIDQSSIYLFLVGGPNSGSPMVIDGYNSFITYVTSLGDFSAANPGYPISFRMRRLQDNTLFKLGINMP
ncbi:thiol-activated cytolysin family protein [Pedobacter roseus]|uniref:Thiol-activated cytolysin family protein n=1 Tax=Pedobacter roseus TaxID=336820 RepID=A0A7G9QHG5_9SPHI|nr:thiol-activated cytolysin family protein [Pedobacter roseus]QNN42790.1 thiol-activated cytolysin family protein [Pedobacter roseus]